MDAYKQLDISDITEAIIAKLETKTDTKDILATIKNNFKDLNNKIKDLKEFNEKLDMKDRTKVIEDTYKLLENIDNT
ncbi:MAG: hypothetical protein HOE82_05625 [Gammaproteobacteria bacterium]|jgi:hypothetical protein|nr:hypothetical protein [Gammaproteobacteria bacterium]